MTGECCQLMLLYAASAAETWDLNVKHLPLQTTRVRRTLCPSRGHPTPLQVLSEDHLLEKYYGYYFRFRVQIDAIYVCSLPLQLHDRHALRNFLQQSETEGLKKIVAHVCTEGRSISSVAWRRSANTHGQRRWVAVGFCTALYPGEVCSYLAQGGP